MSGRTTVWTPAKVQTIKRVLAKHTTIAAALPELTKSTGVRCTIPIVDNILRRHGERYGQLVKKTAPVPLDPGVQDASRFVKLIELLKKPVAFTALCDKLDLSPNRARELVLQARAEGIKVHVENDHVGIKLAEPIERVQATRISPTVGSLQKIGVISDTHLGSKYCLRDQLKDFIHYAYAQGVREILHVGDALDGDYRHGKFEMTHMGIVEQTRDLRETLPQLPGLTYHGITGNHDETFTSESGVDAGEFIEANFKKHGRNDFKFYGNRGAFLKIRGAVVHLWHPRSGGAYAISYPLQKKIEGYSVLKPQILLAGHWHRYTHCYERGVHAIACPTFQAGRSAFSKSLTGAPAIGGLILSYRLTEEGTLRDFSVQKRTYFETERPIEVVNSFDGIAVEPEEQLVEVRRVGGAKKK